METEILGYLASALIGISLGLIGGGGSILTLPVMVYLFHVSPLLATSYSLFVVGSTSLVGALSSYRKGLVNIRAALLFGATSIATVFLTRKFIVHVIPHELFTIGDFTVTSGLMTMILFAVLMLVASFSMIGKSKFIRPSATINGYRPSRWIKMFVYGSGIGVVTGILGAGGGFLLIPALVLLVKIPMKQAVGTSLFIIAMNSLVGFAGDLNHFEIQWPFLLEITAIAIAGLFLGAHFSKQIAASTLKKGFGWFILLMAIYILLAETLHW